MSDNAKYTIVIPVYNEEENLPRLFSELKRLSDEYTVLFVNDCSDDNSGELIKKSGFEYIEHPENYGYGASLKTGIRNSRTKYVIIMDSDGQHKIEEIFRLVEYSDKYDMVVGARKQKENMLRRPGKIILRLFSNYLSGRKIPDLNSGLRVFNREFVTKYFPILPDGFSFTTTITLSSLVDGYHVKYVPVDINPRSGGKSRVGIVKDGLSTLYLILKMMVFFNPLKVFLPISIFLFLLSGYDLYFEYTLRNSFNIPDSFITLSIAALIFFFFGVIADMLATMRKWR